MAGLVEGGLRSGGLVTGGLGGGASPPPEDSDPGSIDWATYIALLGGSPAPAEPGACGANLLAAGLSWLSGRLQAHASVPVLYRRGADWAQVCATPGRTMLRLADEFGATRIEWTDKDFLIPRTSLAFGDEPIVPERGDTITLADDDGTHVYEVLPYGDEPCWRWSDPYRRMVRIHAKLVTAEVT